MVNKHRERDTDWAMEQKTYNKSKAHQDLGVAQLEYDLCDDPLFLNFKKLKAYDLELRATNRNIRYVIP